MSKPSKLPAKISKRHAALSEKSFGIKDIRFIDPNGTRPLHYWISLSLIGIGAEETQKIDAHSSSWMKFSFYEFIWILTIRRLKELNYDNSLLKKHAVSIFTKQAEDLRILAFEKAVIVALTVRNNPVLGFFSRNGEFEAKYNAEEAVNMFFDNTDGLFTYVNISHIVQSFLSVKEFFPYIKENELLQEREIQALEVLYNNPKTEIGIRVNEDEEIVIEPSVDAPQRFISAIMTKIYTGISIRL